MTLRRLLLTPVAVLTALAAAPPAGAIVGGSEIPISDAPYQVALLDSSIGTSNWAAQFCGGSVLDTTHIVTAAHCVADWKSLGRAALPAEVNVLAGTATLSKTSPAGRLGVAEVSFDSGYNVTTEADDAALLTLADALPAASAPVALVLSVAWSGLEDQVPAPALLASGWGSTIAYDGAAYRSTVPPSSYPTVLRAVRVPFVGDPPCVTDYMSEGSPVAASTVCAGEEVTGGMDSCQGDSGGPLVSGTSPNDYVLVGIVSSGFGCAQPHFPGLYTEIDKPSVRSYVTGEPIPPPTNVVPPSVTGTAAVGSSLTCAKGRWTGQPTLAMQWVQSDGGVDQALTASGGASTYPVQTTDVGHTIACIVRGTANGGAATARSAPSSVVPAPPPQTQPAQPAAPPPVPPAPTVPQDVNRPTTLVRTARCVRTTCTLTLIVRDSGFTSGIARVAGSVRSSYRRACTRTGSRTMCTRTRPFAARRISPTRFTVRLTRLPVGTQQFSLLATDRAGHTQLLPTRRTLKTTRR